MARDNPLPALTPVKQPADLSLDSPKLIKVNNKLRPDFFPSFDSYTESNRLVSIPVCCQKLLNFWSNLAKLLLTCIGFDI